jgi:Ca-activated chloride channel family protein
MKTASKKRRIFSYCSRVSLILLLNACASSQQVSNSSSQQQGFEVKFLVGSALAELCDRVAIQFNQQQPKLDSGKAFYLKCESMGSGDAVASVVNSSKKLQTGGISAEDPQFPVLISLDGDIYQSQLIDRVDRLFAGQNYIPAIVDSPLIANSPMVFMAASDVAAGLRKTPDLYKALVKAKNHRDLDPSSPLLPIHFVQTAPTRSNSGLQTLIAQFVSVADKRPEELTVKDIQTFQPQIKDIQSKVTRYGTSTNSLAADMVKNGSFWASIASVYESSVIAANSNNNGTTRYEAIYPKTTFTSNMRAILSDAPWVNADEKAAATKVIEYLRSNSAQTIATELGLRPGVPGIALGTKFTSQFGVNPNAKYDSLRPPRTDVVDAMLTSWQKFAKKPSQVVIIVDSSGSMAGDKLTSVQNTLRAYIDSLGAKEKIILIDFDSEIRTPIVADGTAAGKDRGMQFINSLAVDGGTRLYDAVLIGRNWLEKNLLPNAINAVVILTDGADSGSQISLDALNLELQKSGFASDKRIAFFTIGYGKEGEFNPQVLQQIAQSNGGYYRKGDPESIAKIMADLQTEF